MTLKTFTRHTKSWRVCLSACAAALIVGLQRRRVNVLAEGQVINRRVTYAMRKRPLRQQPEGQAPESGDKPQEYGPGLVGSDFKNTEAIMNAGRQAVANIIERGVDRAIYRDGCLLVLSAQGHARLIEPRLVEQVPEG